MMTLRPVLEILLFLYWSSWKKYFEIFLMNNFIEVSAFIHLKIFRVKMFIVWGVFFVTVTYSLILLCLKKNYQTSKFRRSLLHALTSFTWYPGTKNISINFSHEILGLPTLCYQINNYVTNVMRREGKKVTAILSLLLKSVFTISLES